jgi:hypothetical protein
MHIQPHLPAMRGPGIRRLLGATFVASFIALLAAIPTGTAMAASGEGSAEVAVPVSLASLDPLLGTSPVGTLETGHIATLVLQIPAAGKVVVSGGGVRAIGKGVTKPERLTVKVPLSKAGTASLRKHRNRLSVALKASFKPTSGASSSAGVTVHFA